jgi:hypothetical protein
MDVIQNIVKLIASVNNAPSYLSGRVSLIVKIIKWGLRGVYTPFLEVIFQFI